MLSYPLSLCKLGVDPGIRYRSCNHDVNFRFMMTGDWSVLICMSLILNSNMSPMTITTKPLFSYLLDIYLY